MKNNTIDTDKYILFTTSVFNYYNGKINTVLNNVKLEIQMTTDTKEYGKYTLGKIYIYLENIINKYKEDELIKEYIIRTIIHELYHVDQKINYKNYKSNRIYRNNIELAVSIKTEAYILNHFNNISALFSTYIDINRSILDYQSEYITYKDLEDLYIGIISQLNIYNKNIKTIISTANNISIQLVFGGNSLNTITSIIKHNGKYTTNTLYLLDDLFYMPDIYDFELLRLSNSSICIKFTSNKLDSVIL